MPANTLIGRDTELTLLNEFITNLTTGTGQATLIEGEPGTGKSSIARWVAATAEQRGCRAYWAAADELGQALPLRPVVEAFRSLGSAARTRLDTVQRLLRGEIGNTVDPTAAASEQIFALVSDLCGDAPVVLVVDDLQWADTATIGVWERLARSVDRLPLVLLGLTRPVPQRAELAAVRRAVGENGVMRLARLPERAL